MKALAAFFASLAAVLIVVALVNWRTDLEGEFYDRSTTLAAARASCLVSDELVGSVSRLPFKLDLLKLRRRTVAVVGSSRVLKVRNHPGEAGLVNLGLPGTTPESIAEMAKHLPDGITLYIGTEAFWFNPSFPVRQFRPTFRSRVRYLLNGANFRASVALLREEPTLAIDTWRRIALPRGCVLGRASASIAWQLDGSRLYTFELDPAADPLTPLPYTANLQELRAGIYADWRGRFDRNRLGLLDRLLTTAEQRKWKVVGFVPPDGARYVDLFESSSSSRHPWRTFFREVPALFERHGFPFVDLHEMSAIPCEETDFVDDGYHTNAACSGRIRARLDAAVR